MSRGDNLKAIRRFLELANAHDVEGMMQLVDPGYIGESNIFADLVRGPHAYADVLRGFYTAFPDAKYEIEPMLVEGEYVVARCHCTGTHLGSFMGHAPTGRAFAVRYCEVDQLKEGRIARGWWYWDAATAFRQLGIAAGVIAV